MPHPAKAPRNALEQTCRQKNRRRVDVVPNDKVFNVASAGPLVEWTQTYGSATGREERYLGVPRWFTNKADVFFAEPPESIRSRTGGTTRDVLSGLDAIRRIITGY